jgi:hypothetical protein
MQALSGNGRHAAIFFRLRIPLAGAALSAAGAVPQAEVVDLTGVPAYVQGTKRRAPPPVDDARREKQMSGFDDRKKGQEAKFAHDAELRFKAEARRNKLLGLWAAEHMGLSEEHAREYAAEVVAADFAEAGDEDVFRKVAGDLKAKGTAVSEEMIRQKMAELVHVAREQVLSEG